MSNENLAYISDEYVFDRNIYESTTTEKPRGVLRVLVGPIAEWDKLNRNKRKYSEKLWDKVLSSPYVLEQLKFHTLYGEANHPESRYEVDFERVSHSIVEMWKVPATNQIYGKIYILDTPFGRILNTLYEAGGVIGYSTRAGGVLNKRNGYTEVDENTYNFITLDAVPYPSVESARPDTIMEGVANKVVLSEECHNNLSKIINESSEKEREIIKDLIYKLQNYDLSQEISLLEGNSSTDSHKNDSVNSIEETTKFLLKDNAVQIESLKAENATLRATNESVQKENTTLKANLESSLRKISNMMESSKVPVVERVEDTSKVEKLSNTIRSLEERVSTLLSEASEREFELDNLRDAYMAYTQVKDENVGLKSQLKGIDEEAILIREAQENSGSELQDAYRELTNAIKEINALKESVNSLSIEKDSLQVQIASYEKEISDMSDVTEGYESQIGKLNEVIEDYKNSVSEKTETVDNSLGKITQLQEENLRLTQELSEVRESIETEGSYISTLKGELVSVISSSYGLTQEAVMKKLPVGFTKSDIYVVCENMHNSRVNNGVSVVSIVEQEKVTTPRVEESKINKTNIGLGFSSNRRGIGVI